MILRYFKRAYTCKYFCINEETRFSDNTISSMSKQFTAGEIADKIGIHESFLGNYLLKNSLRVKDLQVPSINFSQHHHELGQYPASFLFAISIPLLWPADFSYRDRPFLILYGAPKKAKITRYGRAKSNDILNRFTWIICTFTNTSFSAD